MNTVDGQYLNGVYFSREQIDAIKRDVENPRWDLNPPQREEYESDKDYLLELRAYADRRISENRPVPKGNVMKKFDGMECAKCNDGNLKYNAEFSELHIDAEYYQCDSCMKMFPVKDTIVAGKLYEHIDFEDYQ